MWDASQAFYAAADVRELDRRAIEDHGIPGYTLMQRAAAAASEEAALRWPRPQAVVVFCGAGNNGGDGYEFARLARVAGLEVTVRELPGERRGDAATARQAWCDDGGRIQSENGEAPCTPEEAGDTWLVDALFGTGLSRPPEGLAAKAIAAINTAHGQGARVLALDVPSGLDCDRGAAPGPCVVADATVTFIADKVGLHTGAGVSQAGAVCCAGLEVPPDLAEGPPGALTPAAWRLDARCLPRWLPPRDRGAHKGRHGHVLVVGGAPGMAGAALLAGRAALRTGAGLVSVATHPEHAAALVAAQPELMVRGVRSPEDLEPLLERASVLALGPGLGQGDWGRALFDALREHPLPKVVDADALNLLAAGGGRPAAAILTPHPGEAARLLGTTTAEISADRRAAVRRLADRFEAVAVLKGAGTLVADAQEAPPGLCTAGNPGLAVGGSGDVLTGVIAALRGQGLPAFDAACAGVTVHAHAGDRAARHGERGMAPGDVIAELRAAVNP